MRIAILCNDTRGGVQPYAALASGLKHAGHEVVAVAPTESIGLFQASGVAVTPLAGTEDAVALLAGGAAERGTLAAMHLMRRELPARLSGWTRTVLDVAGGADLLLGGIGGGLIGALAAERLGVPFMHAHLQPVGFSTSSYPGVLGPRLPTWLGPAGFKFSHILSELAVRMPFGFAVRQVRKQLGLQSQFRPVTAKLPVLYGFSRLVVPMPDGRGRHVTGYWTERTSVWRPSEELDRFVADDRPVVSVGFGSMGSADPRALAALAVGAARRVGAKTVLLGGWAGLQVEPADDILMVSSVPHDWLFPRMAAIVHHGGAGTTAAAMIAGTSAVIVPFAVDQFFWAERAQALSVSPKAVPRRSLTEARLARSLVEVMGNGAMANAAQRLGEMLRQEQGVERAVEIVSELRLTPR